MPVEVALEKTEEETFATAQAIKGAKVEKSRPKKLLKISPKIEQIVEGNSSLFIRPNIS